MSPAEIVSRISPDERTKALIAFVAIDQMDLLGVEGEETRRLHREAHYTDLRDQLVAKANASQERDQAAAAPEVVSSWHRPSGSGGMYTLRSKDEQALRQRAQVLKASIDAYRSPSISTPRKDAATGDLVVEVRYYGLS